MSEPDYKALYEAEKLAHEKTKADALALAKLREKLQPHCRCGKMEDEDGQWYSSWRVLERKFGLKILPTLCPECDRRLQAICEADMNQPLAKWPTEEHFPF